MKILRSWLEDYLKISISNNELAKKITALGSDVEGILEINGETVLELEITPNRADLLSHFGLARDLGALIDQRGLSTKNTLDRNLEEEIKTNQTDSLKVQIKDSFNCPQYFALKISGVRVKESPPWLKKRLSLCGFKPINNIVDATNYIMSDLGQPLHAFDAATIVGREIIVRPTAPGEKITTLDGAEKELPPETLLIADKEKPLAIAGIIGGQNSEITAKTREIILEATELRAVSIRSTAKKLRLTTEASYRFERGIDSGGIRRALDKAASLILDLAGGQIISPLAFAGERPTEKSLTLSHSKINSLLGLNLSRSKIVKILLSLGFKLNGQRCFVPLWRHDISLIEDLAEEVARIIGYSNIPRIALQKTQLPCRGDYFKNEQIKDLLVQAGFCEVINYPFLSEKDLVVTGISPDNLLEVKNPVNRENKYLRQSLTPGLLKSIAKNPAFDPILIFEVGRVFERKQERSNLGIAASGKGAKEAINQAASLLANKARLKQKDILIQTLSNAETLRWKIRKPKTYILETELQKITKKITLSQSELELKLKRTKKYRPISKFPPVVRDLAVVIDKEKKASELQKAISSLSPLIANVELFDQFVSKKFGPEKKSLAFHLYFEHLQRTLTNDETQKILSLVRERLKNKFGAEIR